jgi:hypothetical protein
LGPCKLAFYHAKLVCLQKRQEWSEATSVATTLWSIVVSRMCMCQDLLGIGIAIAFGDRASPGFQQASRRPICAGYCAHCKRSWSNKSKDLYGLVTCATVSVQHMFNETCVVRRVAGHRDHIAGRRWDTLRATRSLKGNTTRVHTTRTACMSKPCDETLSYLHPENLYM